MLKYMLSGLLFFLNLSASNIGEVQSFGEIAEHSKNWTPQTLFVTDVNEVLTVPCDTTLSIQYRDQFMNTFKKEPGMRHVEPGIRLNELVEALHEQHKVKLLEPRVVDFIHTLHVREIDTLALTGNPGRFNKNSIYLQTIIGKLKSLGVELCSKKFNKFPIALSLSESVVSTKTPLVKDNVIFTGESHKDESLAALLNILENTQIKYTTIVYVDDKKELVDLIAQMCQARGYTFHGFVYKNPSLAHAILDHDVAQYQYEHLIKSNIWLSDQKAKEMMMKSVSEVPQPVYDATAEKR